MTDWPAPGVYSPEQLVRRVKLTIDVPQMIEDLELRGLSHVEIRLRCGVKSRSAVSAWASGEKMPSLLPGLRLLLLHLEFCSARSPLRTVIALQRDSEGPKPDQGVRHGET